MSAEHCYSEGSRGTKRVMCGRRTDGQHCRRGKTAMEKDIRGQHATWPFDGSPN